MAHILGEFIGEIVKVDFKTPSNGRVRRDFDAPKNENKKKRCRNGAIQRTDLDPFFNDVDENKKPNPNPVLTEEQLEAIHAGNPQTPL